MSILKNKINFRSPKNAGRLQQTHTLPFASSSKKQVIVEGVTLLRILVIEQVKKAYKKDNSHKFEKRKSSRVEILLHRTSKKNCPLLSRCMSVDNLKDAAVPQKNFVAKRARWEAK